MEVSVNTRSYNTPCPAPPEVPTACSLSLDGTHPAPPDVTQGSSDLVHLPSPLLLCYSKKSRFEPTSRISFEVGMFGGKWAHLEERLSWSVEENIVRDNLRQPAM